MLYTSSQSERIKAQQSERVKAQQSERVKVQQFADTYMGPVNNLRPTFGSGSHLAVHNPVKDHCRALDHKDRQSRRRYTGMGLGYIVKEEEEEEGDTSDLITTGSRGTNRIKAENQAKFLLASSSSTED